jgi:hypothetical protein
MRTCFRGFIPAIHHRLFGCLMEVLANRITVFLGHPANPLLAPTPLA